MNVFELTRALVDIESITEHEGAVAAFLENYLAKIAARTGGRVERMEVEPGRFNVLACWGKPLVTLSTHMDTVPPFFPSREDAEFIWGRGACDAKGIIASMIGAAERLLGEGGSNFGLLFVVGEERNSAGAAAAARSPRGSRYLVNGEPTENKLALASKGMLRYEVIARGKLAHSAYPELGESAIDKLLDALEAVRRVPLPEDALLGPCTLNIGTISGGRAPNVIADAAKAEILVRLVGDPAADSRGDLHARRGHAGGAEGGALHPGDAVSRRWTDWRRRSCRYTTDVPAFGESWGKPLLDRAGQHSRRAHERGANREKRACGSGRRSTADREQLLAAEGARRRT